MSASDDKIILNKTILSLQTIIADLDIEIDEEGSENSSRLERIEGILRGAVNQLEAELKQLE